MTDNVIKFPKQFVENQPTPAPTLEQIKQSIVQASMEEIDEATDVFATVIADALTQAGFEITEDRDNLKDMCLVFEAIKSVLCKYHGVVHSLHPFAQACFAEDDDGVNIGFKFVNPTIKHISSKESKVELTSNDDIGSE